MHGAPSRRTLAPSTCIVWPEGRRVPRRSGKKVALPHQLTDFHKRSEQRHLSPIRTRPARVGFVKRTEEKTPNPAKPFNHRVEKTFPTNSVSLAGEIVHSPTYGFGDFGDTDTPGLLNEVGGIMALGGGEFELFRIRSGWSLPSFCDQFRGRHGTSNNRAWESRRGGDLGNRIQHAHL